MSQKRKNLGFGAANSYLLKKFNILQEFTHVLLLNPDAYLDESFSITEGLIKNRPEFNHPIIPIIYFDELYSYIDLADIPEPIDENSIIKVFDNSTQEELVYTLHNSNGQLLSKFENINAKYIAVSGEIEKINN